MGLLGSFGKDSGKVIFLSLNLVLLCHGQWEEKQGVPLADWRSRNDRTQLRASMCGQGDYWLTSQAHAVGWKLRGAGKVPFFLPLGVEGQLLALTLKSSFSLVRPLLATFLACTSSACPMTRSMCSCSSRPASCASASSCCWSRRPVCCASSSNLAASSWIRASYKGRVHGPEGWERLKGWVFQTWCLLLVPSLIQRHLLSTHCVLRAVHGLS
jgi:hypothetical protein